MEAKDSEVEGLKARLLMLVTYINWFWALMLSQARLKKVTLFEEQQRKLEEERCGRHLKCVWCGSGV